MTGRVDSEPILDILVRAGDESKPAVPYLGHRERLKKKVAEFGSDSLPDYELLELLLTYAIPRKDVKPLAKDLLFSFGSLNAVLTASIEELKRVRGIKENTAVFISSIRSAALRMAKSRFSSGPVINDWNALLDYCRIDMGQKKNECLRVVFLDARNQLIKDEVLQNGTISQTPVYPREVAKRALELGAASVILVHNHPAGDLRPSKNDVQMTKAVQNALTALDIKLIDHLIVSKTGNVSFKACGLL